MIAVETMKNFVAYVQKQEQHGVIITDQTRHLMLVAAAVVELSNENAVLRERLSLLEADGK